ncbi:MAG: cell division protein FtsZ [Bacteroidales bacterium]|nr:cell division protein FtsZ [Bacteroidales bacterium]
MIEFDAPKEMSSMIKVVGVGGGGSNAVNHMFKQGIHGVDFIICNTDAQSLDTSPIPNKVQLGATLTGGRGAGAIPEVGKNAAIENIDELKEILGSSTEMLFITAGMGGGTGTGAAPIIAKAARELGILTVGIVTIPFKFEGRKRKLQAEAGIEELRQNVDTLLIISNDKLRELHGNLTLTAAFGKADDILTDAARGIAEIITVTGYVNVDIEDVKTVMRNSGVAIMGTGVASGEDRALKAVEHALASPLLNDNNIDGASNILLFMASGSSEFEMDEITTITDYIQEEAGMNADIIWGNGTEEELGDSVRVTVVATGFESNSDVEKSAKTEANREPKKVIHDLTDAEEPVLKNQQQMEPAEEEMVLITKTTLTDSPNEFQAKSSTDSISPEIDIKEETKSEDVKIFTLDGKEKTLSRNEHEIDKKKWEESTPEINKEFHQKANDRIAKLRGLTNSFNTSNDLAEIENTPAYIRKGVELEENTSSNNSPISRYTLDGEEGLKSSNSFLHDNVD